jgi:hypothetical protein
MMTKVDIDPRVAIIELAARTDAERAYFTNRILILAQQVADLTAQVAAAPVDDKKAK